MKHEVPIWEKSNLTLEDEVYSGISINKLREITSERGCEFVLFDAFIEKIDMV